MLLFNPVPTTGVHWDEDRCCCRRRFRLLQLHSPSLPYAPIVVAVVTTRQCHHHLPHHSLSSSSPVHRSLSSSWITFRCVDNTKTSETSSIGNIYRPWEAPSNWTVQIHIVLSSLSWQLIFTSVVLTLWQARVSSSSTNVFNDYGGCHRHPHECLHSSSSSRVLFSTISTLAPPELYSSLVVVISTHRSHNTSRSLHCYSSHQANAAADNKSWLPSSSSSHNE